MSDVTDGASFDNLESWQEEFLIQANVRSQETFPFVALGNKCDLEAQRQVSSSKAKAWCARKDDMPYFETSAKTADNVEQAFLAVAKKALEQEPEAEPIFIPHTVDLDRDQRNKAAEDNMCC